MADKQFLIRFRLANPTTLRVLACKAEIHGDHLVFVDAQGKLAALFLLEIVESCNELEPYLKRPVA